MEIKTLSQLYEEEQSRIIENRLLAWSSVGNGDLIGIEVNPLTVQAWIDLKVSGNAYITGDEPTEKDAIAYVWRSCIHFTNTRDKVTLKAKDEVIEAVENAGIELGEQIARHLNEAFDEAPESFAKGGGSSISSGIPACEGLVYAIDEVSARYGQSPESVLQWPLTRVFQLQKAMRIATIPEYKLLQPARLRHITGLILEEVNNG